MSQRYKKNSTTLGEKKFKRWKAIKRNKQIFDIDYIDTVETQEQKLRRAPLQGLSEDIGERFENSFMSTTAHFNSRLQLQLKKRQDKVAISQLEASNEEDNLFSLTNTKGISFTSMISREKRNQLDEKKCEDQRRFNNYTLKNPDHSKTRSFEKYLSRESPGLNCRLNTEQGYSIYIPEKKIKTTTFGKQMGRKNITLSPKFSSFALMELPPEKIEEARLKTNSNWNNSLKQFQKLSPKDNPSQFQRIFHSPLNNYRVRKPRQKKLTDHIRTKTQTSKVDFERWQLCDVKFFRFKMHRTTNKNKK